MSNNPGTETLYVNARGGLNVRAAPTTSSQVITKLTYGASVLVTEERQSADSYQWRHLVQGGWIAEQYTQTTPIPTPNPVATPPPVVPAPSPAPLPSVPLVAMRGLHTSAGGWAPTSAELALVKRNCVESVLIAAYQGGQAQNAISGLRNVGVRDFIVRAANNLAPAADPSGFISETLPRVREYYNILGSGMLVAIHNEPNMAREGWTSAWQNGAEFTQWFLKVAAAYRSALPGIRVGFPALSPGVAVANTRMDEISFAAQCTQAIAASDWIGVHAYFTGDGTDLDVEPTHWKQIAQGKPIIMTEGGPADSTPNSGAKLKNVYAKCAALGIPVMAWLLSGAGAFPLASWDKQNVQVDGC